MLAALMFAPAMMATFKLAEIKGLVWPSVLLMVVGFIFGTLDAIHPSRTLAGMKWAFLTVFFVVIVIGLFFHLKNALVITTSHLYTAVNIYLLLAILWFALYSAIDNFYPAAIQHNNPAVKDHLSGLLYFSLVTLSTIGYGDIVPIGDEARMLAALEGMTGVLYIAITVAILVSSFRGRGQGESPYLPSRFHML